MMNSMWTIATPFANKPEIIPLWLANFDSLQFPRKEFHVVWVDISGNQKINKMLARYAELHQAEFASFQLITNPPKKFKIVTEFLLNPSDVYYAEKRQSVAETMNIINGYRKGHMVMWEDDVIVPSDAFITLKKVFDKSNLFAGVTGVQYQRLEDNPTQILTFKWRSVLLGNKMQYGAFRLKEEKTGVEAIGASSSGFILYRKEFLDTHRFAVSGVYGQDVMAGFRMNGYDRFPFGGQTKLMMCWDVKCPHLGLDAFGKVKAYKSTMCHTSVPQTSQYTYDS